MSGYGYALGYLGGGLLFALNVAMVLKPDAVRPGRQSRSHSLVIPQRGNLVGRLHAVYCAVCQRALRRTRTACGRCDQGGRGGAGEHPAPPAKRQDAPDVPVGVLVLHRRRQHHHQDGRRLRPVTRPEAGKPDHGTAHRAVRRFPGRVGIWLARSKDGPARGHPARHRRLCRDSLLRLLPAHRNPVHGDGHHHRPGPGRRAVLVDDPCSDASCHPAERASSSGSTT